MRKLLLTLIGAVIAMAVNAADWYASGNFMGWSGHCKPEWKFTEQSSGVYTLEIPSLYGEFLICQGTTNTPDWNNKIGTNGSKVKEGTAYKYVKGANNFTMDGTVENATITLNTTAGTITVTGKAEENDYTTVYLVGDFGGGWNENLTTYPLTLKSGTTNVWEGTYTLTAATSYFKMRAGNLIYGTGATDVKVVLGTQYTASQSGDSYSIGAGKYNFSFVLDKNADTGKLTVTDGGAMTYPETIYVLGNVDGNTGEFNPTKTSPLASTGENGVYKGEVEILGNQGNKYGFFQLCTTIGTSASDWSGLGTRYGAEEKDMDPLTGSAVTLTSNDYSWKVNAGKYTLDVNLPEKTMTVTAVEEPLPDVMPELYLRGEINSFGTTDKMTEANGIYTITVPKLAGGFKIADANWSDKESWTNQLAGLEPGKEYVLEAIPGGKDMSMAKTLTDVTVTFNYQTKVMVVTGTEVTTPAVITYAIKGSFTGSEWVQYDMTQNGESWSWTGTPTQLKGTMVVMEMKDGVASSYFKAQDATDVISTANSELTLGTMFNEDIAYDFSGKNIEELTFTFNPSSGLLKATWKEAAEPVEPDDPTEQPLSVTFDFKSWENNISKMTPAVPAIDTWAKDGNTENTVTYIGTTAAGSLSLNNVALEFSYTSEQPSDNQRAKLYKTASGLIDLRLSKVGEVTVAAPEGYLVDGIVFYCENTTNNSINKFSLVEGQPGSAANNSTDKTVTWTKPTTGAVASVKFVSTSTTRISKIDVTLVKKAEPEPVVTYPELYLRGAINSYGTTDKMTEENGIYTISLPKLSGEFKIADADWSDANSWTTQDMEMETGKEYTLEAIKGGTNMAMAKSLTDVTVTFNYETKVMVVTGTEVTAPAVITYTIKGTFTDPVWVEQEMVKSDVEETYSWTGTLAAASGTFVIVENKDGVADKYYKAAAGDVLSATNAEMTLSTANDNDVAYDFTGAGVATMTFTFDPATGALKASWTSGISDLSVDYDPSATYYNLQGREVKNPAPGIYIVVRGSNVTKEYLK